MATRNDKPRRGRPSAVDAARRRELAVHLELLQASGAEIARRVGVTQQTISAWRQDPEYRAAVDLPLAERTRIAQEFAMLMLPAAWSEVYASFLAWRARPAEKKGVAEAVAFADWVARWAGVHPPAPPKAAEDGATFEDNLRRLFGADGTAGADLLEGVEDGPDSDAADAEPDAGAGVLSPADRARRGAGRKSAAERAAGAGGPAADAGAARPDGDPRRGKGRPRRHGRRDAHDGDDGW